MQFLMGLSESFAQIKGQILLMEPIPQINKVYSLLIQEEAQRKQVIIHQFMLNQQLWLPKLSPREKRNVVKWAIQWRHATRFMASLLVSSSMERTLCCEPSECSRGVLRRLGVVLILLMGCQISSWSLLEEYINTYLEQ